VYSAYGRKFTRERTGYTTDVNDPSLTWFNQEPHWLMIEDLAGGTYEIRMKHRRYLPQEPREQDDAYENRLARSTCPPYFQRLERMLAGMLTRKPVKLQDVGDVQREQLFDVDLQGNDLNVWTYEAARKMIRYGHVGVLVDVPQDGNGRPYWVTYTPREILGYRTEVIDGKTTFTQLRLLEKIIEPEGDYGEKEVTQVRVLYQGRYEIHRKNDNGKFVVVDEGETTLSEIPFSVAYANRLTLMESRPPLEDIAELNIKAYQVQSDLDNQLHISAVPLLGFFGFPQSSEEVTAGPNEAIAFPAEGRAEYIEPTGRSFDSQFQRLEQLEKQINELGLAAVLGQKLSAETAEAKKIDRSQGDSTMMVVAQQMQDLIDNSLVFHAQLLNTTEIGSSFVNRDFLSTRLEPKEIQSLLQLYTAGTITQKTLLDQLTQGEVLGDEFDVEEEIEATQMGGLIDTEAETPEPEEEPAAEQEEE
jgi:nitrate reductase NapAB chaperone NapD